MKLAAVHALAELATLPVPEIVTMAYNEKQIVFGDKYIIPKPLDPRLLATVAPAVAKAAMESGVARVQIENWDAYKNELNKRLGLDSQIMRAIGNKARREPKRVVFAEAENAKILKAIQIIYDEGIAYPILLGDKNKIEKIALENQISLIDIPIIDPKSEEETERREVYGDMFFKMRQRKGINERPELFWLYDGTCRGSGCDDFRIATKLCRNNKTGPSYHWKRRRIKYDCRDVFNVK
jgi:malate dehydrogenase (oxaloacetate-decarboxylating)(NADP+)